MFLIPQNIDKPRFGIIFGDLIHNLRSALNYIVTALADASNVTIDQRHQFPIYIERKAYKGEVGTAKTPTAKGPLHGITHGLGLIEQLQSYHQKPDPRADPLWHLHRFSNADKHRNVAARATIPRDDIPLQIRYNGTLVDRRDVPEIIEWEFDKEFKVADLRFDPPIAHNLRTEGPLGVRVLFRTPPFRSEHGLGIDMAATMEMCVRVRLIVEQFETL